MPPNSSIKFLLPAISPAAPGTLYDQIITGLKRTIGEGKLEADAVLPSFRQLAEELMVSVITIKRAYEELEREGIIYRRQGLGTFVAAEGRARSREVQLAHARELLKQAAREAAEAGLSPDEVCQLFQQSLNQTSLSL